MSSQLIWSALKPFASRNSFDFTFLDVVWEFSKKIRVHLARILANIFHPFLAAKLPNTPGSLLRTIPGNAL